MVDDDMIGILNGDCRFQRKSIELFCFIIKNSTLKNVRFWEPATDIYIRIIVKSYSLIIGNGYSDRSRAPIPFRSCKNRIFGDDDHPCSQDLD